MTSSSFSRVMGQRRLLTGVTALALAAAAFYLYRGMGPEVQTAQAGGASLVATVVATGPVDAAERAEVVARVGALVERLLVTEGEQRKAGDVLALQNATGLTAAVAQARAEVARQEQNLAQLLRKAALSANQAEIQIEAAQTKLQSARVALSDQQRQAADRLSDAEHATELVRQTLKGGQNLGESLAAARRRVDEAKSAYDGLIAQRLSSSDDRVRYRDLQYFRCRTAGGSSSC